MKSYCHGHEKNQISKLRLSLSGIFCFEEWCRQGGDWVIWYPEFPP
jgi:hypothetical protein